MAAPLHTYLIGVGANQRSARHGPAKATIAAAAASCAARRITLLAASRLHGSAALGPSRRAYLNAVWLIETDLPPDALIDELKRVERFFGRRAGGQRWSARPLDLDILLWNGGVHTGPALTIPHPAMRERAFVLRPAMDVAAEWRDPVSNLSIAQLWCRMRRSTPMRDIGLHR